MRYAHTCIRVKNLEETVKFYTEALNYVEAGRLDYPEDKFTIVYLELEGDSAQLELTYNYDHPGYDLGNGYSHIALYTDSMEADHARLKDGGYKVTDLAQLPGDPEPRFFFITDPDGYDIEIINENYYK